MDSVERTAWENLGNAIVLQACDDYRVALRLLAKHPDYARRIAEDVALKGSLAARLRTAVRHVKECEAFFRSAWFRELTSLDPGVLIAELRADPDVRARGAQLRGAL